LKKIRETLRKQEKMKQKEKGKGKRKKQKEKGKRKGNKEGERKRAEPVFVNLLRSRGIDSQPVGSVRQPI
jgi:hypothetical protein